MSPKSRKRFRFEKQRQSETTAAEHATPSDTAPIEIYSHIQSVCTVQLLSAIAHCSLPPNHLIGAESFIQGTLLLLPEYYQIAIRILIIISIK